MFDQGLFEADYRGRLTTADDAVAPIADGSRLIYGLMQAEPQALLWAFANRLRAGDLKRLRILGGPPQQCALDTVLAADLADRVERWSMFVGAGDRGAVETGIEHYLPNHFHQMPRLITEHMQVDVVATTVSPMDRAGFFTFGVANDFISTAARCAKRLIVEVNRYMPRVHGESCVHISEVSAVVENDVPLQEIARAPVEPADETIARRIVELVPDGATLQLGVGAFPQAVCGFLTGHRELGIHTEYLGQGMIDLVKRGIATGTRKTLLPRRHVFTFAAGDTEMMDLLHDNPAFESHPVSFTNHPAVIARNDNMISINSVLEVDLLGQANAEFLAGHQYSGSGGQLDFVRGAYDAKGGKSILAFRATTHGGSVSRIVPRLAPGTMITTPRNDIHYLATEFGLANLKGSSTRERALAIIELADPRFRDDLLRAAQEMCIV
jgi:itaconate CoA-transferase